MCAMFRGTTREGAFLLSYTYMACGMAWYGMAWHGMRPHAGAHVTCCGNIYGATWYALAGCTLMAYLTKLYGMDTVWCGYGMVWYGMACLTKLGAPGMPTCCISSAIASPDAICHVHRASCLATWHPRGCEQRKIPPPMEGRPAVRLRLSSSGLALVA